MGRFLMQQMLYHMGPTWWLCCGMGADVFPYPSSFLQIIKKYIKNKNNKEPNLRRL